MSRVLRVRLGVLVVALLAAVSVWGVETLQRQVSEKPGERIADAATLAETKLEAETAIRGLRLLGLERTEALVEDADERFDQAFLALQPALETADERRAAETIAAAEDVWDREVRRLLVLGGEDSRTSFAARDRAVRTLVAAADDLRAKAERSRDAQQARLTAWLVVATLVVVGGTGIVAIVVTGRQDARDRRRRRAVEQARAARDDFAEALQLVDEEEDAHRLLKRHVERIVPSSWATVLSRNNSDNRLDATTEPPKDLQVVLRDGVEPRDCLATRAGRPHARTPEDDGLVRCELCGDLPGRSVCQPLTVSGEVIGAVLVEHDASLAGETAEAIAASVAQAAPVIGNLRTLAIAETRAATDALTGLPNRRALQDTLKRMVAQSARSLAPLAAVAIDLDHFKQVNDRFGHEKGDEVLAAVGRVVAGAVRNSDFAARAGGEELCVLLPDTEVEGAVLLADKLRVAISRIEVPGVDQDITASFGVAGYPYHAFDAPTLLRKADRALYLAKEHGRNRVEVAATPVADDARRPDA